MLSIDTSRRHLLKASGLIGAAVVARISTATARAESPHSDKDRDDARSHGHDKDDHCFLVGTRLLTDYGYRAIESLSTDDLLLTKSGALCRPREVKRYEWSRNPGGKWFPATIPVVVSAGSLGENRPIRDLYISRNHGVLMDSVLVDVGYFINGTTIHYMDVLDKNELVYYHVELDRHDIIFAEGVACETFRHDEDPSCVPIFRYSRRDDIMSHLRSAIAPVYDSRMPVDYIREATAVYV